MTEAIRIAVLNSVHETVTFLPNDTTLDDFVHDGSPARGEALLAWEPRSYMGGFVKVAREHAGVELVGIESPLSPWMARWACAVWRGPRPTSPAACARSWAATPSSPAPSIRTATRTPSSCVRRTSRSARNTSRTTTG